MRARAVAAMATAVLWNACAGPRTEVDQHWMLGRSPVRVIDGARVDLKPLQKWWIEVEGIKERRDLTNAALSRPLKAWVRVRAIGVELTPAGVWILDAEIMRQPKEMQHQKIILRHPPEKDRERFLYLAARFKELAGRVERMNGASEMNSDAAAEHGRTAYYVEAAVGVTARSERERAQASAARQKSDRQAREASERNRELSEVRKELSHFQAFETYKTDVLALPLRERYQGLPVFDCGRMTE